MVQVPDGPHCAKSEPAVVKYSPFKGNREIVHQSSTGSESRTENQLEQIKESSGLLVSHGRVNSVKIEIIFTSSAGSIIVVHNLCCDKCISRTYLKVSRLSIEFLG